MSKSIFTSYWNLALVRERNTRKKEIAAELAIFFFFLWCANLLFIARVPLECHYGTRCMVKNKSFAVECERLEERKRPKKKKMTTKNVIACATKCIKPTHGSKKIARKGGSEREKKFKKKNTQSRNVNTSCHFLINKTIFTNIFIVYYFRLFYHSKGNPYGI